MRIMSYRWEVAERIARERVIAVIRSGSAAEAIEVGRALTGAGVKVLEVALTTPGGVDAIRTLAAELGEDHVLGAGTVLDAPMASAAIAAGARFLVSPGLAEDVIRTGNRYGVPALPGAGSVTEIVAALEAGAEMVKFFPASALGIDYMKALRPVLPQAPLVPTGGIGAADARRWLEAGAVALGVGGSLTRGDRETIGVRARELLDAIGPLLV
jgi:2-dehydro-3-deoxyphosphogluconate aldolase / (4S)-4-hydroxy-2-oxoglutarate aldolase